MAESHGGSARLRLRELRARAVCVPMRRALVTAGGSVTEAPFVLLDLHTHEGVTGHSYVFAYSPLALSPLVHLLHGIGEHLAGECAAPAVLNERLAAMFRLIGPQGLNGMAAAAVDIAAWDATAKAAGLSLARLLGGEPRALPAYNSNGLGLLGPERASTEAEELLAPGFAALKIRLGYDDAATDVDVVRAVRDAVPSDTVLMADYNQCLDVPEAVRRMRLLDAEGLQWVEEPIRADDYTGHARIRAQCATPVQLGENCWGVYDFARALEAGAGDFLMPDANKIGGVSGWLRAAALAEAHGVPLSSHLYPEVSAHLLCVSATAHWLEFVDWASPILAEPLELHGAAVSPSTRPGVGLAWDEAAIARFARD